jgi:iron-sulfur cluster assembly protein
MTGTGDASRRTTMQIQISEEARAKLLQLGLDGTKFLRVEVVPGGCSGMTYDAFIDDTLTNGDEVVYESDAVRVIVDALHAPSVAGLSIDYSNDLVQAGFRLTNRLAVRTCGCGSSFAVAGPGQERGLHRIEG